MLALLLPSEGHLSSYGYSGGRNYKGYHLSKKFTTGPNPPAAERGQLDAQLQKSLDAAAALAAKAFAHYVKGNHPYVAVREYVLDQQEYAPDAGFWRTSGVALLDDVELTMFVKPNISDLIRNQIPRDFLLSQLSPGGVLSSEKEVSRFSPSSDPRPPEVVLEHGLYSVNQLLYALRNRSRIKKSLTTLPPASAEVLQLRAIEATLDNTALPPAVIDAALALPPGPRARTFKLFLDLSPRTDRAQVVRWAANLEEHTRAQYVDASWLKKD